METSERQFMYAGSGKDGNNASEKKFYGLNGIRRCGGVTNIPPAPVYMFCQGSSWD